jgi:diguanylate cyclase (GGDEF)-like protein
MPAFEHRQFLEKSKTLQTSFVNALPQTVEGLEQAILNHQREGFDFKSLHFLYHRFHQLSGGAASLGIPRLAEKTKALEQLAIDGLVKNEFPNAQSIRFLLDELEEIKTNPVFLTCETLDEEFVREPADLGLGENAKVLVLAKTPQRSKELAEALRHFGYAVTESQKLTEIDQKDPTSWPELLIADASFLKEEHSEFLKKIPSLFFSEVDHFSSQLDAARYGALGYFIYPFDVAKLVDRVAEVLRFSAVEPYRILVIDDDELLAEYFELVLETAGFVVEVLSDVSRVLSALGKFRPDLILMDVNMPECSGAELARVIRFQEDFLTVPIVFLSAETDWNRQMVVLGSGGDDFLTKPIKNKHLIKAVQIRAQRARLLNDLIARDSMTGLLKHARIKEQLKIETLRARRSGLALCVVMIDIDHFKKINDQYGHAMGDRVIKTLSHLLKQRLRKSDLIGRYGGEEFMVVLPESGLEASHLVIEDIRKRFENIEFLSEGVSFKVTLSAGISMLRDDVSDSEILEEADRCLYQAKHGGRNAVVLQTA